MIDLSELVERIVSGGQTGADRAALDWATDNEIPHEGWCPADRRAEDGPIDEAYRLRETPQSDYRVRTRYNVRDSDATVIIALKADLMGGSLATQRFARAVGKPCIHIAEANDEFPQETLREFVRENGAGVLNVAGPRASGELEIGVFVKAVRDGLLIEETAEKASRNDRTTQPRVGASIDNSMRFGIRGSGSGAK